MDIERVKNFYSAAHKEIDGWFFNLDQIAFFELFAMQNSSKLGGDVAEVGVYKGKSLVFLSLLKHQEERIVGFDLFDEDHEEQTKKNVEAYGNDSNLSLVKGLTSSISVERLDTILFNPLRFLHIDAGHEYHEVLEQLLLFTPYLADFGIIAMDDYQDREFPGIESAVLDFCEIDRPRRFVPFLSGGNKLYMCRDTMAQSFQRALLSRQMFSQSSRLCHVRDFSILIMRSKLPVTPEKIISELDARQFPKRPDTASLHEKSIKYSQIRFNDTD